MDIIEKTLSHMDYKDYAIGVSVIIYLLEQYIHFRQYLRFRSQDRPKELQDIITQEEFLKSQRYNLEKSSFRFVEDLFSMVVQMIMLYNDFLAWLWNTSQLATWQLTGYGPEYEIIHSIIFTALYIVISHTISIPFSLYSTFVVEQRHGFNNTTFKLYCVDMIKSLLLVSVLINFLAPILWIIKNTGDKFVYYVWLTIAILQFSIVIIYPTVIQPLFNTLTPLEDGELKTKIQQLSARIEFPLKDIYVIDGSKRSNHSNAYFYGFGKSKHIVLFDTLIEQCNIDDICGVFAHELGHWKLSHTYKLLALTQVTLLSHFWFFSFFLHNDSIYADFGFSTKPVLIGLCLFQYIYGPMNTVIELVVHMFQRKYEYGADEFARDLGYTASLKSALTKLNVKNLGLFDVDPWYSALTHSHPTLLERLRALSALAPEEKKKA